MVNKQQILLVHGGTTFGSYDQYKQSLKDKTIRLEWIHSRRDWKNELQDQLGENYDVYVPQMPNKTNAQYAEWKLIFEKVLVLLETDIILIGYSLGAIFLVKYLSENEISKKIEKTFLIGTPFDDENMGDESLHSFLRTGPLSNFESRAGKVYFYHSRDDFAVPFVHLSKYKAELPDANFREFEGRNHFLQENIPELINDIVDN